MIGEHLSVLILDLLMTLNQFCSLNLAHNKRIKKVSRGHLLSHFNRVFYSRLLYGYNSTVILQMMTHRQQVW